MACGWLLGFLTSATFAQPPKTDGTEKSFTEELRQHFQEAVSEKLVTDHFLTQRSKSFGTLSADTPEALRTKYETAFSSFRDAVWKVQKVFIQHQVAWSPEQDLQRLKQYGQLLNAAQAQLDVWRDVIAEVYVASPTNSESLGEIIGEMIENGAKRDMFEGLIPMARAMMDKNIELPSSIIEAIGYIGYANNDYALAEAAWTRLGTTETLSNVVTSLLRTLSEQRIKWAQEIARREADAARDDNPQVEILTNKGRIVVELFEEEAPQAVANFIFLAEQRFYHKKMFFRVIEHFAAQTGCEKSDGTGDAGYTIRSETSAPNHRNVFRGSLVLLSGIHEQTKLPNPDSGSSQIFFAMLPLPKFDGQMTVFGRVIEGLPILGTLQRVDFSNEKERKDKSKRADLIIDVKVLRKRNHEYIPEVASGRLP